MLLVFRGVMVITLVRNIGLTFCLRIGTGLAVSSEGLLDWQFDFEEEDCF